MGRHLRKGGRDCHLHKEAGPPQRPSPPYSHMPCVVVAGPAGVLLEFGTLYAPSDPDAGGQELVQGKALDLLVLYQLVEHAMVTGYAPQLLFLMWKTG